MERNKIEREVTYKYEIENKKVQSNISRLKEQGRCNKQALMNVEQEEKRKICQPWLTHRSNKMRTCRSRKILKLRL